MGAIATPCVPVCLLVSEHAEMGIHHEVYHLIGGRAIETLTEPVNRQISGCHGIKEEVLQVLQVLVREEVVCHVDIIGTGSDGLGSLVDSASGGTISLCFQSLKWGHLINNVLFTSEVRCNNLALRFQLFVFSLLGN